ncbi:MAG TPA: GntR family transcriptional regulator [Spirillospora sp.]|nr:GntR family transcriptional regulator [Spirillospora sp.]
MHTNQDGIAIYRQIADILVKRIRAGQYSPGERLPSDRELSAEFGHNRHTVRRALDVVEELQLITRHQGKGTFVVRTLPAPPEKKHLSIGLIDTTRQLGTRPPARVLSVSVQSADQVAFNLNLNPGDLVTYLHRLRLIDNTPMIVEHIYVPQALAPKLEDYDLNQSLHEVMTTRFQIEIAGKDVTFESIPSDGYISQLLNIPVGSPMLLEKRLSYTTDHVPCEYSEHIYRGDRFVFRLK